MSSSRFSFKTSGTKSGRNALLTPAQMACADALAIEAGASGIDLMWCAGQAVADLIRAQWSSRPVSVLCGFGNNGGDGFVVARLLHEAGWPVRVGLLGCVTHLAPDAYHHAQACPIPLEPLTPQILDGAELVVDALVGAGLSRPISGVAKTVLEEAVSRGIPMCAIDVPSGVDGASGQILGTAAAADHTVTFFRKKPGHLLFPGRKVCGRLHVADIGIPDSVLPFIQVKTFENHPDCWLDAWPTADLQSHKYQHGHVLIRGGQLMTGAARLAALAAARIGAGLVTVAVDPAVWPIYAAALTSVMVSPCADEAAWAQELTDTRRNAIVVGPGAGLGEQTRRLTLAALNTKRAVVLDADAISVFARDAGSLWAAIEGPCVLTPHEGEFARIFRVKGDKLSRALEAARLSGAIVVLKGADTIIASPDGQAYINSNAPAWLATAGSGDVLTGMIAGLLAQGMPAFQAAGAAVYLHGWVATEFGPGLIAEDLPDLLPKGLASLASMGKERSAC